MTSKPKTNKKDLTSLVDILSELERREKYCRLDNIFPDTGPYRRELYYKHIEFINATATHKECIFMAGNRTGKTLTAAYFIACVATGRYPHWWEGKRWPKGARIVVAGQTKQTTRDVLQYELVGDSHEPGTGLIPKDYIVDSKSKPGIPNALESLVIRCGNNHTSTIMFTSYEQGFKAIRGLRLDVVWVDEECPLDYYSECLVRTMTTKGTVLTTFTPDEGLTPTVLAFLKGGKIVEGVDDTNRFIVNVGWDDVPHLSEEDKSSMLASLPPYLRDAKSRGIPAVGEGAIYPVLESDITCRPFKIPPYWPRFFAIDVGWQHPTAVCWFAYDRDADILYLYSEYKQSKKTPREHAIAIKDRGSWIPGVIDPASSQSSKSDGARLVDQYSQEGLMVTYADNSVEAGIMAVLTRFNSGRLKIFNHCRETLLELRLYRREKGKNTETVKIVKENDDLMDAMRYGVMSGTYLGIAEYEADEDDNVRDIHAYMSRNSVTGY